MRGPADRRARKPARPRGWGRPDAVLASMNRRADGSAPSTEQLTATASGPRSCRYWLSRSGDVDAPSSVVSQPAARSAHSMIIAGSSCHSRSAHATMTRPRVGGGRPTWARTIFVAHIEVAVAACSSATVHSPRCHLAPTSRCATAMTSVSTRIGGVPCSQQCRDDGRGGVAILGRQGGVIGIASAAPVFQV